MNDQTFFLKLKKRLLKIESIKNSACSFYLIGSMARGDYHNLSDIDIVVLGDSKKNDFELIKKIISKEFRRPCDFIIIESYLDITVYDSKFRYLWQALNNRYSHHLLGPEIKVKISQENEKKARLLRIYQRIEELFQRLKSTGKVCDNLCTLEYNIKTYRLLYRYLTELQEYGIIYPEVIKFLYNNDCTLDSSFAIKLELLFVLSAHEFNFKWGNKYPEFSEIIDQLSLYEYQVPRVKNISIVKELLRIQRMVRKIFKSTPYQILAYGSIADFALISNDFKESDIDLMIILHQKALKNEYEYFHSLTHKNQYSIVLSEKENYETEFKKGRINSFRNQFIDGTPLDLFYPKTSFSGHNWKYHYYTVKPVEGMRDKFYFSLNVKAINHLIDLLMLDYLKDFKKGQDLNQKFINIYKNKIPSIVNLFDYNNIQDNYFYFNQKLFPIILDILQYYIRSLSFYFLRPLEQSTIFENSAILAPEQDHYLDRLTIIYLDALLNNGFNRDRFLYLIPWQNEINEEISLCELNALCWKYLDKIESGKSKAIVNIGFNEYEFVFKYNKRIENFKGSLNLLLKRFCLDLVLLKIKAKELESIDKELIKCSQYYNIPLEIEISNIKHAPSYKEYLKYLSLIKFPYDVHKSSVIKFLKQLVDTGRVYYSIGDRLNYIDL